MSTTTAPTLLLPPKVIRELESQAESKLLELHDQLKPTFATLKKNLEFDPLDGKSIREFLSNTRCNKPGESLWL